MPHHLTGSEGAQFESDPLQRDYRPLLFLVAVFAILHIFVVLRSDPSILDYGFSDPDAYGRMVRVQDLLESGNWFDSSYSRVNPPAGHVTHWTRPMDAVILAEAKLLGLVLDDETALHWAGITIGPVLHLLTLLMLVLGTRPLFGSMWSTLCGLLFLLQPPLVGSFIAGRPDHQSLQLFFAALTILLAAYLLLRPFRRPTCYALGVTFALALWTSVETILPVAGTLMGLCLAWIVWRRDFAQKGVHVLLATVGGLLVALAFERSPQELVALPLEADRLSFFHVLLFALVLGFWLAVHAWDRTRTGETGIITRAAVAAAGAAVVLGLLGLIRPAILIGKVASVDPLYLSTRTPLIGESQPIYLPNSLEDRGLPFVISRISHFYGYSLAGVLSLSFFLIWPGSKRRELWVLIASILVAVTFFSMVGKGFSLRGAPIIGLVMLFPYSFLVAALYQRLSRLTTRPAELMRATCLAALVLWPLGLVKALGSADAEAWGDPRGNLAARRCLVKEVAGFLAEESPWRDRPRRIMTYTDVGPEIMYRTRHFVFSIPNHRLQPGYTDSFRMMAATRDAAARAILARRQVDLILVCRTQTRNRYYRSGIEAPPPDQSIFRERLLAGDIPDWLQPVPLPGNLGDDYLLLQVDRDSIR